MDSHLPSNRNESWTDEKHVHFLNSMEACFVRTMLENNGRYNQRLDRHLPDSSESTLDCKDYIQTRKKHATSGSPTVDFIGTTRSKVKGRLDKRSRRPSSQPHDSSQDQVGHSISTTNRLYTDLFDHDEMVENQGARDPVSWWSHRFKTEQEIKMRKTFLMYQLHPWHQ